MQLTEVTAGRDAVGERDGGGREEGDRDKDDRREGAT